MKPLWRALSVMLVTASASCTSPPTPPTRFLRAPRPAIPALPADLAQPRDQSLCLTLLATFSASPEELRDSCGTTTP